ncbi:two-component system sensor kinase [[Actinomadura] parvosata subsp. kistnae]|nr:two-component system sensor kinase [Actinomadura parvosata subsp. kistnae]
MGPGHGGAAVPVGPAARAVLAAAGVAGGGARAGAVRGGVALAGRDRASRLGRPPVGGGRLLRRAAGRRRGAGPGRHGVHGDRGGDVPAVLRPAAGAVGVRGVAVTVGVLVAARPADGRTPVELLASFVVGVLVTSMAGLVFQTVTEQNERLKQTTARLAALAEENAELQAQLLTQAREAGVLGERQRMAREIHDTIAQGLTAILTQLEALGDVPGAGERLATVRGLARESLSEARRSVRALRPVPLEESPELAAALTGVAERWSRVAGVPAAVSVTGAARPLHPEVEDTLLRVAQEALANVARHARAGRVVLTLSYMDDVVALDVRDDGAGFVHEPGRTSGFGLVGMRQRVTRLAGRLEIETAPGQGTGISATVPAIPAAARS